MKGKVFLIPTYLSQSNDSTFISQVVSEVVRNCKHFLVENVRTSRRFISSLKLGVEIHDLIFFEMDKDFDPASLPEIFRCVRDGSDIALMSEAGMPGIADPGKWAVQYAHENGFEVIALQGTSSIVLALVSSGFNGQEFTFHGYLPIEQNSRIKKIKALEREVQRTGYTQIFMETPYRNQDLLKTILNECSSETTLFVGSDLGSENSFCKTATLEYWKKHLPNLHKIPAIFAFGI